MTSSAKKLILVIGATGAQGLAVIDALLAPATDGSPSPYAVRALTRDSNGKRARELAAKGVELASGEPISPDSYCGLVLTAIHARSI
jgi:nucleoside-diphosphate-sugar epimerase